uniref:Uncharacterized protein n=1 Tax=Ixodes ricinus TaxID=34613 RepID=V5I0V2_IXORI
MGTQESYLFFWFVTFCGMFTAFIPLVVRMVLTGYFSGIRDGIQLETSSLRLEGRAGRNQHRGRSLTKVIDQDSAQRSTKCTEELSHQGQLEVDIHNSKVRLGGH